MSIFEHDCQEDAEAVRLRAELTEVKAERDRITHDLVTARNHAFACATERDQARKISADNADERDEAVAENERLIACAKLARHVLSDWQESVDENERLIAENIRLTD